MNSPTGRSSERWLLVPERRRRSRIRLVIFPHAGGSAGGYYGWHRLLPDEVELAVVEYPGRGSRFREPYLEDFSKALLRAHRAIAMAGRRLAFFGHSMGALFALEMTRRLEREAQQPPCLFVSACRAPVEDSPCGGRWRATPGIPDDELTRRYLDSVPAQLKAQPELMAKLLEVLRADVRLMSTYRWTAKAPVRCPIVAFGGADDPQVPALTLEEWRRHSSTSFAKQVYPGGHSYLEQQPEPICREITRKLLDAGSLID